MSKVIRINSDTEDLMQKVRQILMEGENEQIQELYGIEVSATMVSNITDQVIPEIKEWQARPLDDVYPFVFIDAVHFSVREDNHIIKKAAYIVLGINSEGFKEVPRNMN